VEKTTKRDGTYRKCVKEGCDWRLQLVEPEGKTAKAAAPVGKKKSPRTAPKKPAAKGSK
jgi:DNA topoisomerase-1